MGVPVESSHPASFGCGPLGADGTAGLWVLWEWPSRGRREGCQSSPLASPNYFQTLKPGTRRPRKGHYVSGVWAEKELFRPGLATGGCGPRGAPQGPCCAPEDVRREGTAAGRPLAVL